MLLFPKAVFNGASEGLLLWFQIIFPTLFPFLVVTSLLMSTGGLRFVAGLFGKPLRHLLRVSHPGAFAVLAGFLCGYPHGSKSNRGSSEKRSDHPGMRLSICSPSAIIQVRSLSLISLSGRHSARRNCFSPLWVFLSSRPSF